MKNIITLIGAIVIASFLVFVHNCVAGLAAFAGRINPALEPWVFWGLLLPVAVSLGWAAAVALLRPRPMLVHADPTPEELAGFRRILAQRLARNRTLREAGLRVTGEADLEAGLALLRERADAQIRSTARQVFVSTALAQNGRLDSLVVLFLITRLTWRLSRLYNQRPHPRELVNLYANIAATSLLAGAIDELGVDEYVRELMGPLVGGSAIGMVPGAQAVAGVITASVLSGSTNCLLALRCGIVARDYLSLHLDARGRMRRSATLEASRTFMTMSADTVLYVTRVLVTGARGAVRAGSARLYRGVGDTVAGTAEAVGGGARGLGRSVASAGRSVAGAATGAAMKAATRAAETARTVGKSAATAASGARAAGRRIGSTVGGLLRRGKGRTGAGDEGSGD
jgi:hypothetical protein